MENGHGNSKASSPRASTAIEVLEEGPTEQTAVQKNEIIRTGARRQGAVAGGGGRG